MSAEQSRSRRAGSDADANPPATPAEPVDESAAAGSSAAAHQEIEELERLRARLVRKFH
jgi:hypothetical protein